MSGGFFSLACDFTKSATAHFRSRPKTREATSSALHHRHDLIEPTTTSPAVTARQENSVWTLLCADTRWWNELPNLNWSAEFCSFFKNHLSTSVNSRSPNACSVSLNLLLQLLLKREAFARYLDVAPANLVAFVSGRTWNWASALGLYLICMTFGLKRLPKMNK